MELNGGLRDPFPPIVGFCYLLTSGIEPYNATLYRLPNTEGAWRDTTPISAKGDLVTSRGPSETRRLPSNSVLPSTKPGIPRDTIALIRYDDLFTAVRGPFPSSVYS